MTAKHFAALPRALPFWVALGLVPVLVFAAARGGWALILPPVLAWGGFGLLDAAFGKDTGSPDPDTDPALLFWHRLITLIWFPIQLVLVFGMILYASEAGHLSAFEKIGLFFGVGVVTGTVGINFSHELMHRTSRLERWLADLLLAMVMYSHFRSEHLMVHHAKVGTPADAVTAHYGEGFGRFFPRVLWQCLRSAWRAEARRLEARGYSRFDSGNPFWRYWSLQGIYVLTALVLGGWAGLALFLYQGFIAVWQLELVNYVEHYGLTRAHLGDGRYEPVAPRHSWNAAQAASNRLLINLQRHSDHHVRPARPYPLLQHYLPREAPELPFGYPVMTIIAMWPPAWRRMMNWRVRKWRAMFYPEITDWQPHNRLNLPRPANQA